MVTANDTGRYFGKIQRGKAITPSRHPKSRADAPSVPACINACPIDLAQNPKVKPKKAPWSRSRQSKAFHSSRPSPLAGTSQSSAQPNSTTGTIGFSGVSEKNGEPTSPSIQVFNGRTIYTSRLNRGGVLQLGM